MSFAQTLSVKNYPFNKKDLELIKNDEFAAFSYPVVYILYDEAKRIAYVGESTNAISRLLNHLSNDEKKKLKAVYVISNMAFNKSATLDIEAKLIEYLGASGKFKLLNGNGGISSHNYYQKSQYLKVFEEIWSRLDFDNIKLSSLLDLENSELFKFSPYKALTEDQFETAVEILNSWGTGYKKTAFVNGSAGTGKTILAVYLIKLLATCSRHDIADLELRDDMLRSSIENLKAIYPENISIGLVVPMTSLRTTLKNVFRSIHGLSPNMVLSPVDVVKKHYDVLIVDEAHRLSRRKGIMGYAPFDAVNRKLGLYHSEIVDGKAVQSSEKNGTQLDWIMKCSNHQLFFYDSEQSIKPADVRKNEFLRFKNLSTSSDFNLVSQMRSNGGADYIEFVNQLLHCAFDKDSPENWKFSSQDYELTLFEDMGVMLKELRTKEKEWGLCRTISGYSWEWVSKREDRPDVVIDGVELTWNRTNQDWISSTTDVTEMGCIHTTQGYDLNYAAIIFGEEISYDPVQGKIVVDKSKYYDTKGKQSLDSVDDLLGYIIKIYKTLMYRAIKGTYIYVCDNNLREYFKRHVFHVAK